MKIKISLILFVTSIQVSYSQVSFSKEFEKVRVFTNMEGFSFTASSNSKYQFHLNGQTFPIDFSDTLPLSTYNYMVETLLYPGKPIQYFPKMIWKKGENQVDSINLTEVGLLTASLISKNQICHPKIVPLGKTVPNNNQLEFILLSDAPEGVSIDIFLYDKAAERILSYVTLFQGEKLNKETCDPLGINLVASYQTKEIKNGIITQIVNDGFNDLWERKIRLNKGGFYELLWYNNPLRRSKVYEAYIQDKDGSTNVRKEPNINSQIIYKISKDEKFLIEVYPESQTFYKIYSYKNYFEGWIHKSRVKKVNLVFENLD